MQEQNAEGYTEKKRKIAVALSVAGTMLFLFLFIILVIQFVKIGVSNAKKKELDERITQYEEIIAKGEKDLEYYNSERGKYDIALEQGWKASHD